MVVFFFACVDRTFCVLISRHTELFIVIAAKRFENLYASNKEKNQLCIDCSAWPCDLDMTLWPTFCPAWPYDLDMTLWPIVLCKEFYIWNVKKKKITYASFYFFHNILYWCLFKRFPNRKISIIILRGIQYLVLSTLSSIILTPVDKLGCATLFLLSFLINWFYVDKLIQIRVLVFVWK